MTFTLPYPPSVNAYLRYTSRGVYLTKQAKQYKTAVGWKLFAQGVRPIKKPEKVVLTVKAFRPRASGDLDNILKVLIDALNKVAFEDDSQVIELHCYRADDRLNSRVEVTVTQVVLQ